MAFADYTDATSHRSERSPQAPTRTPRFCPSHFKQSEDLIAALAEAGGWTILSRNFRRPGCEIDIIMMQRATLVGLEVKYRSQSTDISNLVSDRKKQALIRGLEKFLALGYHDPDIVRIDLAVVSMRNGRLTLTGYHPDICQT